MQVEEKEKARKDLELKFIRAIEESPRAIEEAEIKNCFSLALKYLGIKD